MALTPFVLRQYRVGEGVKYRVGYIWGTKESLGKENFGSKKIWGPRKFNETRLGLQC